MVSAPPREQLTAPGDNYNYETESRYIYITKKKKKPKLQPFPGRISTDSCRSCIDSCLFEYTMEQTPGTPPYMEWLTEQAPTTDYIRK